MRAIEAKSIELSLMDHDAVPEPANSTVPNSCKSTLTLTFVVADMEDEMVTPGAARPMTCRATTAEAERDASLISETLNVTSDVEYIVC